MKEEENERNKINKIMSFFKLFIVHIQRLINALSCLVRERMTIYVPCMVGHLGLGTNMQ